MANRRGSGERGAGRPSLPPSSSLRGPGRAESPPGEPKRPRATRGSGHFDDYEREGWSSFVRDVDKLGLLSTVDGHAAGIFAMAYGGGRGTIATTSRPVAGTSRVLDGGKVLNPAVTSLNQNVRTMLSILSSYGFRRRPIARDAGADPSDGG